MTKYDHDLCLAVIQTMSAPEGLYQNPILADHFRNFAAARQRDAREYIEKGDRRMAALMLMAACENIEAAAMAEPDAAKRRMLDEQAAALSFRAKRMIREAA